MRVGLVLRSAEIKPSCSEDLLDTKETGCGLLGKVIARSKDTIDRSTTRTAVTLRIILPRL